MNKMLSVLVVMLCMCSGCSFIKPSLSSMNIQRSGIRGTGDTATTVAIDALGNDAEAESVRVKVKEVAMALQLFLKNGKVAELTIPEFTKEIEKLVPKDYQFLVEIALAQIQGITVDVQKLGADNLERVNSLCVGILRGCDLYEMKYRPVKNKATGVRVVGEIKKNTEPEVRFGIHMKREMGVN